MNWFRRDKPKESSARQRDMERHIQGSLIAFEKHRELLIASPSRRMEIVALYMRHYDIVPPDIVTAMDDFAQIQIKRSFEEYDKQRSERVNTVVNNYVVGHRPEDLEGNRGLGSAAGGVPEGGAGDSEGSGDVTGA